jgi:hypothetical protein
MLILNLMMRWLHIASVITAVGSTVFMRVVLIPSMFSLPSETRTALSKTLVRPVRLLLHSAIGGILVSGLYNTHIQWRTSVYPYPIVYGLKIVLALALFMIAFFLTSSNPKRAAFQANRKKWLGVNMILAAILVALSAYLRSLHQ